MYSNPIVTQESRGSHRSAAVHSIRQLQWSLSSHTLGPLGYVRRQRHLWTLVQRSSAHRRLFSEQYCR